MIQITPHMRVFVGIEAADFRCGVDGLAAACRQVFNEDPFSGALFVFRNKARTAIKILMYDSDAFWLCHRRLSSGRLKWWPKGDGESKATTLDANELQILIWNGDPRGVFREPWKRLTPKRRDDRDSQGRQDH